MVLDGRAREEREQEMTAALETQKEGEEAGSQEPEREPRREPLRTSEWSAASHVPQGQAR